MKYVMTNRDKAIIIGLIGVVILVLTIKFVYMDLSDKTTQLKTVNKSIQDRVDVLQSIADQQAELVATTNSNNQTAETIMSRFPSNVYEEDVIMFATALEEVSPYDSMPDIKLGAPTEKFTFENIKAQTDEQVKGYIPEKVDPNAAPAPAEGDAAAAEQGAEAAPAQDNSQPEENLPVLYTRKNSIQGFTDYEGLKNAIRYIVDSNERCSLDVNVNNDPTTGLLQATIDLGSYYITGTDKPYIEPEINNVIQGTDNIFGSLSLSERGPLRRASADTEGNNENTDNSEEE